MAELEEEVNNEEEKSSQKDAEIIFHEIYFFPLRHQSNIYGLVNLHINGSNKLVVTTLPGQVFSLEFHDPLVQRPPLFKEITFSYIPGRQNVAQLIVH